MMVFEATPFSLEHRLLKKKMMTTTTMVETQRRYSATLSLCLRSEACSTGVRNFPPLERRTRSSLSDYRLKTSLAKLRLTLIHEKGRALRHHPTHECTLSTPIKIY